ncbi:hypothetical protein [Kitasatospora sp. Root107]|uniref:hypothetical protein n=1 Tax=Kitasatospora sp. Root107 TaxID=1736424 RepID=UPI0007101EFB|nr:hypothetical protein [Kitasatospora sp. Root107]KQV11969.1 hypothetical protein ASC99_35400 [Kitasatospora sp. Root107]
MRMVFECLECGVHYLPPEDLRYGDGSPASPVWCSPCQGAMARCGVAEPKPAAAIALMTARQALKAAAAQAARAEAPAVDVRPSRPARTRRATAGPTRTRERSRLR